MCVWLRSLMQTLLLHTALTVLFITQTECVYCKVQTEYNSGRCRIWNHIPRKYPYRLHKTGNHNAQESHQQISLHGQRLHSAFNGTQKWDFHLSKTTTLLTEPESSLSQSQPTNYPYCKPKKICTHPSTIQDKNPLFHKLQKKLLGYIT